MEYEKEPLRALTCEAMAVELVDKAWDYIHQDLEPAQVCAKIGACH